MKQQISICYKEMAFNTVSDAIITMAIDDKISLRDLIELATQRIVERCESDKSRFLFLKSIIFDQLAEA